nr:unnamed protein product [Callosobruchus chinensis]
MALTAYCVLAVRELPYEDILFHGLDLFQSYNTVYSCLVICAVALSLKCSCAEINSYIDLNQKWISYELHRRISETEQLYRKLYELVVLFNKIFGWNILLLFSYITINVLEILNHVTLVKKIGLDEKYLVDIFQGVLFLEVEPADYKNYYRMESETYQELLDLVTPYIERKRYKFLHS